jgi:hypothetical protein
MRFPAICALAITLAASPAAQENPKILALNLSSNNVASGDVVSGSVVTSTDVAQVEAHLAAFSLSVPYVSAGHFAIKYVVPPIPFFLKGRYNIDVVAKTSHGATVHRIVPITVH